MLRVLRRIFGPGRGGKAPVTCFIRENGPIAYRLEVFGAEPREQARTLLDSQLWWSWKSGTREWTELTPLSLSAFLNDLSAGALMVGADHELPTEMTDALVKGWIRQFCRVAPVPLAAVVHVQPDRQLLFVQQHAPTPVAAVLDALGLDRQAAARRAYAHLGADSLEALAERL